MSNWHGAHRVLETNDPDDDDDADADDEGG